jgi:3-isopropylmalate/(R)-2-methylmalate dehydratase small subunit
VTVDLRDSLIRIGNQAFAFTIDPIWRTKLLNGWDDLDLTVSHIGDIERFESGDATARPWLRLD